jgi:hypothetical protein
MPPPARSARCAQCVQVVATAPRVPDRPVWTTLTSHPASPTTDRIMAWGQTANPGTHSRPGQRPGRRRAGAKTHSRIWPPKPKRWSQDSLQGGPETRFWPTFVNRIRSRVSGVGDHMAHVTIRALTLSCRTLPASRSNASSRPLGSSASWRAPATAGRHVRAAGPCPAGRTAAIGGGWPMSRWAGGRC